MISNFLSIGAREMQIEPVERSVSPLFDRLIAFSMTTSGLMFERQTCVKVTIRLLLLQVVMISNFLSIGAREMQIEPVERSVCPLFDRWIAFSITTSGLMLERQTCAKFTSLDYTLLIRSNVSGARFAQ